MLTKAAFNQKYSKDRITVFCFNYCILFKCIFKCNLFLWWQSNPSEIILIYGFGAQETFLMLKIHFCFKIFEKKVNSKEKQVLQVF